MTSCRQRILSCLLLAGAFAGASAAEAAGPPLPSQESGRAGAVAPGGTERLITRRAGYDTWISAVRRSDGRVMRSRQIGGRWSVPAVTLDNATTGLSGDGRTLVLARPTRAFPPASTRLAVVDAHRLVVRRLIALPGFFTVDAISPDGRWLYLIQYPGENVLDYRVRALDTRTGRLDLPDVVDPRNPGEQMGGLPMTRAVSRDGRWAYTLYGGEESFIHALDTVGRTAACVDLDMLPAESDLSRVRLAISADAPRVEVRDSGNLVATVDARTFAVSEPGAPAAPRPDLAPTTHDGGVPWPALLIGGLAAVCAVAVLIARRRTTFGSSQSSV
jgi:hypothetical protein